jgi:hypothetical protein
MEALCSPDKSLDFYWAAGLCKVISQKIILFVSAINHKNESVLAYHPHSSFRKLQLRMKRSLWIYGTLV